MGNGGGNNMTCIVETYNDITQTFNGHIYPQLSYNFEIYWELCVIKLR